MILPQWTEKYNTAQGGRDFLGYMNVGVIMLERLLPGISNITDRLRYYSFFSWVLYRFIKSDHPKNNKNYKKYLKIKSLAFLYANGFLHQDSSKVGLNGIEIFRTDIKNNGEKETYEWDDAFVSKYKDNYWIYSQKMKQVGITADIEGADFIGLTKTYGKSLAEAYEDNIKDTKYFKKYCDKKDNNIPADVLKEYAEKCSVTNLHISIKEQQLLQDIIFRPEKISKELNDFSVYYSDNPPNGARARRESLLLMLDMVEQKGDQSFDYEDFQKIVLYSNVQNLGYKSNKKLVNCLEYWRIFQARQLLIYAIESYFSVMTEVVYNRNIDLSAFIRELNNLTEDGFQSVNDNYEQELSIDTKLKDLVKIISAGKTGSDFDKSCNLESKINEWDVYKNVQKNIKSNNNKDCLAHLVYLLSVLYLRFNYYRVNNSPYWDFGRIGETVSLSIDDFFLGFEKLTDKDLKIKDMVEWIAKELVIKQHCRVALAKLSWYKNNTFHFEYSAGRIKGIKEARPNINAPKFENVINFLEDLNLVERRNEKKVSITIKGKKILNEHTK
ncbi:hypothetical protein HOB10_00800 [Candidatus Parcubacteria bacterium]|jgi:predicted transcriptional regulator|nr:hypothetical protein [Candidatus Parcubacteria bacterium]